MSGSRVVFAVVLVVAFSLLAGCSRDGGQAAEPPRRDRGPHLVEVTEAVRDNLAQSTVHTGTLRARRTVRIFNQEAGQLVELPYFEGDRVARGAVLARLDDRLLKAQLDKASASLRQAELDVERLEGLVARKLATEDELARTRTVVELARADKAMLETRMGYMRITAPFAGHVVARLVEPGDAVPGHTHLMTLTDPTSLVVELQVSELLIPQLKAGDPAEVQIDALGERRFPGTVQRIHTRVDARTGRGVVEVALAPVPERAQPGQFARVRLDVRSGERLVVPFSALHRDRQSEFVYLLDGENRAVRTPVRSGQRLAGQVEILEGLEEGAPVIIKGFLGLHDGKQVRPVGQRS